MCLLCRESHFIPEPPLERIREFVHNISNAFPGCSITLIGSYSRGDYHDGSDVDLVVVGSFIERFVSRIGRILDLMPPGLHIDVDVLAYTPEEFEMMEKQGNPFIENVDQEGIRL